jgi:crescentin
MFEGWSLLKRREPPAEVAATRPAPVSAPAPRPAQLAGGGPLDALGQQSESVRDRVNRMAERLDEVRSLSAEFGLIVGPLNDFVDQHAASRARLMEVEALLARERDLAATARAELGALQVVSAKTFGDFQDALAALTEREETIRRQDVQVTELRIRTSDLKSHGDSLESRLFAEADRAKSLADDNAALRGELAVAEEARVATERALAEARETLGLSDAETSRLGALTETLSLKIAGLNRIVADLEPQLQMARSTTALVQGKFAVEQSARQKSEAARDAERAAHEMELASRSMKIDGLTAHVANTDKLIAHLRDQLHDKSEAFRVAEKGLRDATAERLSLERRLESALEASARTGAQLGDMQRSNIELGNRADMLAKAVAAKDGALDAANRKSATLLDRIESLNARFALERSEFEATHRRMIEELQSERAERSLAHGALDIARKSRSSLLAQYTALKRRTGAAPEGRALDDLAELDAEAPRPADSNVMAFAPPEPGA